jgi:hypothetical protein
MAHIIAQPGQSDIKYLFLKYVYEKQLLAHVTVLDLVALYDICCCFKQFKLETVTFSARPRDLMVGLRKSFTIEPFQRENFTP